MSGYDLIVRGGEVATAADRFAADIAVSDGRIVAIGEGLAGAEREIDARGLLVLPGGIDSHCHIEQPSSGGVVTADDFYSGSVSAAFGGTTTIIPFAAQQRGRSLRAAVEAYHDCARPKAVIDYAFHLIISDPSEPVLGQELPALIRDGYSSFKIYMTYDSLRLDDAQVLDVLATARREGAMTMVHAENHEVIQWLTRRLLARGHAAPRYHAVAHADLGEAEATSRAIRLGQLVDTPLLIVHVSSAEAMEAIRAAQSRGLKVYGETCPQYLFLTAQDLDRPGMEGAKLCCSPPPRDAASQEAIWRGLANGTFQVFSSDHAPYRADPSGKLAKGPNPGFPDIANGVPGIELRLPLLFSEGLLKGRLDLRGFVAVTATNAARLYGLERRKGSIAVGLDADLALWDPEKRVTVSHELLHDNMDYTPYEGREITGWPVTVLSRGRVVVEDGELRAGRGSGAFQPCEPPEPARPRGAPAPELDPARNFGAELL